MHQLYVLTRHDRPTHFGADLGSVIYSGCGTDTQGLQAVPVGSLREALLKIKCGGCRATIEKSLDEDIRKA